MKMKTVKNFLFSVLVFILFFGGPTVTFVGLCEAKLWLFLAGIAGFLCTWVVLPLIDEPKKYELYDTTSHPTSESNDDDYNEYMRDVYRNQ